MKDYTPCIDVQSCGHLTLQVDIIYFGESSQVRSINIATNTSILQSITMLGDRQILHGY